jgi:hypothetical protein
MLCSDASLGHARMRLLISSSAYGAARIKDGAKALVFMSARQGGLAEP